MKWYTEVEESDFSGFKTKSKFNAKAKKTTKFYNVAAGFDIETTSEIQNDVKVAYMYIWQFGIDRQVFYGRTWEQFNEFLNMLIVKLDISIDNRLVVYVHNLPYEFQFIRKFFDWEKVFAVDDRKVINAVTKQGFEFRDSYILSGLSLEFVARNLVKTKVDKLVGELDYSLVRNSKTELSKLEMSYCKNDILIILYYIEEQMFIYKDITKIPMTNTGRVRTKAREACFQSSKNHKKSGGGKYKRHSALMKELTLTQEQYLALKKCFMGGFTHASRKYAGQLLHDVTSIDFTSSYPSVMLAEKFPMSKPMSIEIKNEDEFFVLVNDAEVGLYFDVKFIGLTNKNTYETYLSASKCGVKVGAVENNGRIFSADVIETSMTDIDFKIMSQCYDWEAFTIKNCNKFYMSYLPRPLLMVVLELYGDKTKLKGVAGYETEYMLSKGMLNSMYGMIVTDVIRELIEYIEEWNVTKPTEDEIINQIEVYNNSAKRFLYYPWGVWVTAYARKNLWEGILNIGDDYVYSDTDSIKLLNYESHKEYIKSYNDRLVTKLKTMCEFMKIDFELMNPKTKEGVAKMMGVWDYDGHYKHFKALRAKRYLSCSDDNKLTLTCAGLSKTNGIEYMLSEAKGDVLGVFKMFEDGLTIPADKTGKSTHNYVDEEITIQSIDYQGNALEVNTLSGLHLGACEFTMAESVEYTKFLTEYTNGYLYKGTKGV